MFEAMLIIERIVLNSQSFPYNYTSERHSGQSSGTIAAMIKTIALLTDFGLSDAYVGVMKGVMRTICPEAQHVDITHAIAPQNVPQAAFVLWTAYRYFPPDTVFLVVVDPGVGTARQPVAVQTAHGTFVAPDNGVLSYILLEIGEWQAAALHNPAYHLPEASHTFHGRDIFSPAAAHLANGVPLAELGPAVDELVRFPVPALAVEPTRIQGEVLHIDHFGNIVTSIGALRWIGAHTLRLVPQFGRDHAPIETIHAPACRVTVGNHTITGLHAAYGAVAPGTPLVLVGSSGQLEIGINQGHAARTLGIEQGEPVILEQ